MQGARRTTAQRGRSVGVEKHALYLRSHRTQIKQPTSRCVSIYLTILYAASQSCVKHFIAICLQLRKSVPWIWH
jgi:hypothetical protein